MTLKAAQPGKIGNLTIKNRFVRSATMEGLADDAGGMTDKLLKIYDKLAAGGTGLIITSHTWVKKNGQAGHNQLGVDDDKFIKGLAQLTKKVHDVGEGAKVVLQMTHCGRQTHMQPETVAASAVFEPVVGKMPRALTIEEIKEIIAAFAEGARRARDAGFDGVQLHSAHGWLLSGFLSPYTNHRSDAYGGSTENRCRIVEEIYDAIVKKTGKDFPVLVKMNVTDFLPGGLDIQEVKAIASRLARKGYAAIETSGGMWECITRTEAELGWKPEMIPESRVGIKYGEGEAYFRDGARAIKKEVNIPVILVGGVRSIEVIESVLSSGDADYVSLSRPLIKQPDLPNKLLSGALPKAQCISCSGCLDNLLDKGFIACNPRKDAK